MTEQRITRREFVRDTAAGAAALATGLSLVRVGNAEAADTSQILNYNPDMEYRLCGKTGWMVSAVCLGGHWKRIVQMIGGAGHRRLRRQHRRPDFQKNRYDVVTRCMERGINYIDACTHGETQAYSKALKGRRDKMHLGWSWYENEARRADRRTPEALVPTLEEGMKQAKEEYVDLWRITCCVDGKPRTRRQVHHDPHPGRIRRDRRGPGQGEEVGQGRARPASRPTTASGSAT